MVAAGRAQEDQTLSFLNDNIGAIQTLYDRIAAALTAGTLHDLFASLNDSELTVASVCVAHALLVTSRSAIRRFAIELARNEDTSPNSSTGETRR